MGIVYKARQLGLNRLVALKKVKDSNTVTPKQIQRFLIEAEAVARLRHPNVVQVHEVGETEGLPYLSMELLEGGSLAEKIGYVPQPARWAAEIIATLSRAVHAAHRAGIVHRDLKPQNVLFDRDGTPKVSDFGLAKRLDVEGGLTMTEEVVGTPAYMAPEQAAGRNHEVGPAVDIYSLGAILYSLLTGQPPLQGSTWRETLLMVVDREPVPPSKIHPKIPRDLETICLKCIAKDSRRRYVSAEALAEDLDRFLEGMPILARRTPAWERGAKWARRHPTISTLAAISLISCLVLAAEFVKRDASARLRDWQEARRLDEVRREVVDGLREGKHLLAGSKLEDARLLLTGLATKIEANPRLGDLRKPIDQAIHEARRGLEEKELLRETHERFVRFEQFRDEALFQDARFIGNDVQGHPERARDLARKALTVFGSWNQGGDWAMGTMPTSLSPGERDAVTSGCYLMLVVLAEAISRTLPEEDARRQATEAIQVLDRAKTLGIMTWAYRNRRAAYLDTIGDAASARLEREEARQLKPANAFDHFLLGQELAREGDLPGSLRQLEAAVREQPDLFWARFLSSIAYLKSTPPRPGEAQAALYECLRQRKDNAWLYLLRGTATGQLGVQDLANTRNGPKSEVDVLKVRAREHLANAEDDFRKALSLGLDADLSYVLYVNRGVLRFQEGLFEESVADLERAIALDSARNEAHAALGQALSELQRYPEAVKALDRAVECQPDMPAPYRERARIRLRGDRSNASVEAALLDLDKALHRAPPSGPDAALDHTQSGQLLNQLDRYPEALAEFEAALAITPDLVEAHQGRIKALLDLGRFGDVIGSCDAALAKRPTWPELLELRGLARVARNEYAAAIDDFSRALVIKPDRLIVHRHRGWAYLSANAPELAFYDFDLIVQQDPSDADGYAGRAAARVRLRQHKAALADVEESLRKGVPTARLLYNGARTYALAKAVVVEAAGRLGRPNPRDILIYESRALKLMEDAWNVAGDDRSHRHLRESIEHDVVMQVYRNRSRLIPRGSTPSQPVP